MHLKQCDKGVESDLMRLSSTSFSGYAKDVGRGQLQDSVADVGYLYIYVRGGAFISSEQRQLQHSLHSIDQNNHIGFGTSINRA